MAERVKKPAPKAKKPEVKEKTASKTVAKDKTSTASKPSKKAAKPSKTSVAKATDAKPAKSKVRKPRAKGRSPRDQMIIEERQELVYQLYRRHKASLREISRILEEKGFGRCSKSTIGRDLQAAIKEHSLRRELTREDMLETLIDDVRDIQSAFAQKALKEKDVQAGKLLLECSKEIDRLTNTSKNSEATTDAKAALAKLLGVDPEAIDDGSESV